jgi:chromosome segregation ATPase
MIKKIEKTLADNNKVISQISAACAGLFVWVKSMLSFYTIFKEISKLEKKAKELTIEKEKSAKDLKETKEMLAELEITLEDLNMKYKQSKKELKELEETLQKMEENLKNGRDLIDGLGAE